MCEASDATELIRQLESDYKRDHYDGLQQSLGSITQNHIGSGTFNLSRHATDRWVAHDHYVKGLIDYVVSSLPSRRGTIHRSDLRRAMGSLVESQYNRVKGDVLQTLINAGLSDPNILRQYESQIERSIEKAKGDIDHKLQALVPSPAPVETGAQEPPSGTRFDRLKHKAMNNRLLAGVAVIGVGIIFLGGIFAAFQSIKDFLWSDKQSTSIQKETTPTATDPNSILQDGSMVGRVVGKVEREDNTAVFQMLVETSELDEQSPFTYKGTIYRITTIGKRSGTHISNIYGMNRDAKSDVICEVLR